MILPDDTTFPNRPIGFATYVAPALVYTSVLFYGGLIRLAALPPLGPVPSDKLLHAGAFGGLALLLVRTVRFLAPSAGAIGRLSFGFVGASALGALLEVCQSFTPYRTADSLDWLADTVGAALALGLAALALQMRSKRSANG